MQTICARARYSQKLLLAHEWGFLTPGVRQLHGPETERPWTSSSNPSLRGHKEPCRRGGRRVQKPEGLEDTQKTRLSKSTALLGLNTAEGWDALLASQGGPVCQVLTAATLWVSAYLLLGPPGWHIPPLPWTSQPRVWPTFSPSIWLPDLSI